MVVGRILGCGETPIDEGTAGVGGSALGGGPELAGKPQEEGGWIWPESGGKGTPKEMVANSSPSKDSPQTLGHGCKWKKKFLLSGAGSVGAAEDHEALGEGCKIPAQLLVLLVLTLVFLGPELDPSVLPDDVADAG